MRISCTLLLLAAACRPPGWGNERPDGSVDGSTAVTVDAAIDAAPSCERAFRLDGHGGASSAWLTGDFVQWAGNPGAGAIVLALGNDGAWTGKHTFFAGTHQYKFVVSGNQWIQDPTNPDEIDDTLGGKNSVYVCMP